MNRWAIIIRRLRRLFKQSLCLLHDYLHEGVLMTMRKWKLAILAIAVLLQVHTGASYLFAQNSPNPQTEVITRQETLRGSVA